MPTIPVRRQVRPKSLTLSTADGKTYEQMSKKEKDILANVLQWNGKTLKDCSRGELIDCIVHTTQQVVLLNYDIEKIKKQRGLRAALERLKNWWRKNVGRHFEPMEVPATEDVNGDQNAPVQS